MAVETNASAAAVLEEMSSETAPMSPAGQTEAATSAVAARRGWLRRLISREYLPRSRRWKMETAAGGAATAAGGGGRGGGGGGGGASRLASALSRSLRWKRRLPGFSLSLRSGSASAVLDAVAFRFMYVVEAVVLGLALSCFFLCCGCHL